MNGAGGPPAAVRRRIAALAGAAVVLAVAGCRTPWYKQDEKADVVRTEIHIRSEPEGAAISFDGQPIGKSPLTLPVEYDHVIELWARAGNPGADIRESTGPVGTVLLAPIWIPASIPQRREEKRRNVYGGNVHEITADWGTGEVAAHVVTLNGEESVEVTLRR